MIQFAVPGLADVKPGPSMSSSRPTIGADGPDPAGSIGVSDAGGNESLPLGAPLRAGVADEEDRRRRWACWA